MNVCHSDKILLEWQHLNYKVKSSSFHWSKLKSTETTINVLKDVSGSVRSGQLVAIVGPSGSGKTTLLAAISQRLRGNVSGTISINGSLVRRSEMVDRSSFLPQFDISYNFLTVYEHMCFVYKLKNCSTLGPKNAYISNILRNMGLNKVASSRIAVLSGGERKKLLLATELLIDPSIIFCDEPTTGLDSFNALSMLSSLQQLVADPSEEKPIDSNEDTILRNQNVITSGSKMVICSIHQPSSEVFACFSHVILMQEGRIAFQGTVNEAEEFFSSFGFVCAASYNRADFFANKLSEKCYDSNHNIQLSGEENSGENVDVICEKHTSQEYVRSMRHVSWCQQVFILFHLMGLESIRSFKEFIFKLLTFLITGLFIAIFYGETNDTDQRSIQNINGWVQTMVLQVVMATAYNVIFYYPSKLPLLRRETGETKYSLSAFYVAYHLSSWPKSIIECFVFLAIVFPFSLFLRGFWMYVKIGLTLSVISIPATAYGLMLSGIFESSLVATSLAPPFDIVLTLIGGLYVKLKTLYYLKYLSLLYYASEALSIVIWKEANALSCAPAVYTTCFSTGSEVLKSLFFETTYSFLWIDYAGLIVCAVVMNVVGFLGIRRMVMKQGFY